MKLDRTFWLHFAHATLAAWLILLLLPGAVVVAFMSRSERKPR